jgi:hypothetical protein
LMKI